MSKLIIHDLGYKKDRYIGDLLGGNVDEVEYISQRDSIYICTGCYSCWIRTPGECRDRDMYCHIPRKLHEANSLMIVTRGTYGGFSPFVKNVMDRAIGYMHPYFKNRGGEMHHKMRYRDVLDTKIYYYGKMTRGEKKTAEGYSMAVGNNFNFNITGIYFGDSIEDFSGERMVHEP